ncbi:MULTISPECIES: hypothetical protein [Saccharothrix]|uniref:hypothetical protein n=1 Tax=Saccharothrix TaxID=2071 RepID=UPI0018E96C50|nr:hypothetical protein [Saccharothrix sp. CB00851]
MPRRSPGAVRADTPRIRRPQATPPAHRPTGDPPIKGLSPDAQHAVDRLGLSAGAAFEGYRRFLHQPGRWLYVPFHDCPCCAPTHGRDTLELALDHLPRAARAALRRLLAPLDEEFHRRTLPNPHSTTPGHWWHRRLYERD